MPFPPPRAQAFRKRAEGRGGPERLVAVLLHTLTDFAAGSGRADVITMLSDPPAGSSHAGWQGWGPCNCA